jgi:tetratricopeptide (TPR) repeat protein
LSKESPSLARRRIVRKKSARKPDEFISAWAKVIRYFYENQLFFYITVSLVIALAVGMVVASFLYFHRQTESQEILNNGIKIYRSAGSNEEDLDKALLAFTTVAKKYPLSKAKKIALLYQGDVLFDMKKYDDALAAFKSAEKKLTGPLKDIAAENTGYTYEQMGDYEKASEVFKRLISPTNEDAYLDLIRNLEKAGKKDDVEIYAKEYLTHFPDSSHAPLIEEKTGLTGNK